MNRHNSKIIFQLPEALTGIFIALMIGIFPLYYRNNYIDIMSAKIDFFRISSICFLTGIIITSSFRYFYKRKNPFQKSQGFIKKYIYAEDIFAFIFAFAILMSAILAEDFREVWLGTQGRLMGASAYLLCVIVYFAVSRCFCTSNIFLWIFLISNSLVFVLGILNFWGFDPLQMYSNLILEQHKSFFTTIGNRNFTSNYLCLVIPIAMVLYYFCTNTLSKVLYSSFLLLGFYVSYTCSSDSWVLGYGAAFLVLFWFSLENCDTLKKFLRICLLFYAGSIIMKLTACMGILANIHTPLFSAFQKPGYVNLLLKPAILVVSGAFLAGLYLSVCYVQKKNKKIPYPLLRKYIFGVLGLLFLISAAILLSANLFNIPSDSPLNWLNRFRLTDSFGSNRGYIWRRTCIAYKKLPLLQKLFGYGADCFQQFINVDYGQEIRDLYTDSFLDAHNEFLQFLATTGIVGVIGYFGLLFTAIMSSVKKSADSPVMMIGAVTISCYLAQGVVNNPQIFTTPLLFIFLGVLVKQQKVKNM